MGRLIILGAGDWTINIIELFNLREELLHIFDFPRQQDETRFGFKVKPYLPAQRGLKLISSVGDPRDKRKLVHLASYEASYTAFDREFINLIHPSCVVLPSAKMGKGIYMQPFGLVYGLTEIGNHVSMCGQVNVGHHTKVGAYSTLCPHVVVAGNSDIGEGVFLGLHSKVKNGVTVGDGAFIGQGANVLEDVPENAVVVGNPARVIKELEKWD